MEPFVLGIDTLEERRSDSRKYINGIIGDIFKKEHARTHNIIERLMPSTGISCISEESPITQLFYDHDLIPGPIIRRALAINIKNKPYCKILPEGYKTDDGAMDYLYANLTNNVNKQIITSDDLNTKITIMRYDNEDYLTRLYVAKELSNICLEFKHNNLIVQAYDGNDSVIMIHEDDKENRTNQSLFNRKLLINGITGDIIKYTLFGVFVNFRNSHIALVASIGKDESGTIVNQIYMPRNLVCILVKSKKKDTDQYQTNNAIIVSEEYWKDNFNSDISDNEISNKILSYIDFD